MKNTKKNTRVSILVLAESSMMTLSSVLDPLRAANRLSRLPLFSWRLLSVTGNSIQLTCGIEIAVDDKLQSSESGNVLIVVGGFNQERHFPKSSLPLLKKIASKFSTVCAVESATWVLARAGIIHDHRVTTHWEDLENFAFAYPGLKVVGERFVIDRNIWSSGGASPSLDMLLHYLRITQHRSLALDVANVFIYNESQIATEPQSGVSLSRLERVEPRLADAIKLMQTHIETTISIDEIARRGKTSQRNLELLSQKHLGLTPASYYLRLRLQAARRLVLDSNSPMSDVAVRCGFNSQSSFSRAFRQRYKQSPTFLRQQSLS